MTVQEIDPRIRFTLVMAITTYDRKESTKRYYNRYALGIMLRALDDAMSEVAEGTSLHRALYDHFNGRVLTALEKAAGLPITYGGGGHDTGRPA